MSHRLYIITGKGGVGKTSLAMSLAKNLENSGKKVLYNSFDQEEQDKLCQQLDLPSIHFNLIQSAQKYMANKLGSEFVAGWVMKTPFFKSLFNMIPGLGHMILLGHIIDLLESDPELTIVLDSPSSGHALTMFESSHNFKEIFGSGLIVSDIAKMHDFIYRENTLKTYITSLPTKMALNEAQEVKTHLQKLNFKDTHVVVNDCLSPILDLGEELPYFLETKKNLEISVLKEFESGIEYLVPHSLGLTFQEVVEDLTSDNVEVLK